MGMQHTPGPWEVEGPLRPGPAYRIRSARGLVTYVGDPVTASYDAANARLIAAAPELLSELRDILDFATTERSALREQEIASIRAVIAKAEGRQ